MIEALQWSREPPYHIARFGGGHYAIEAVDSTVRYFELWGTFIWPRCRFYHFAEAQDFAQTDYDNRLAANEQEPDAVDLIQELMDRRGLARSDIFSAKSRASEIMNRKRPMTLALIRKLHFEFGLPAEKLIAPYRAALNGEETA